MLSQSPFLSNKVINESVFNPRLRTYFVGYDLGKYRLKELTEVIMDALVDFSFGYHTGILKKYDRRKLKEAAKSLYRINDFSEVKWAYVDQNLEISDEDLKKEKKYLKRGEFGELILHLILRDFVNTVPLLSKIHFKDADGMTIHGFDAVHIGESVIGKGPSLYLGETKIYSRSNNKAGEAGIKDLIEDIKKHFKLDFLNREIILVGKKRHSFLPTSEIEDSNEKEEYINFLKEKEKWFKIIKEVEEGKKKLQDFMDSVTIPLLCTYQSDLFSRHNNEFDEKFKEEYDQEVIYLKNIFESELMTINKELGLPVITNMNIVLMLFPIPSKKELIKTLHQKLYNLQNG